MYSANVHSWIETLLAGTPAPAHCGAAAVAVPAAPRLRPVARTATTRLRTMSPRPLDPFMRTPLPECLAGTDGRAVSLVRSTLCRVGPASKRRAFPGAHSTCD